MPARRLFPKGGWTRGGVPARTLGLEGGGVDCDVPHWLGRENKTTFINGMELFGM